MGNDSSSGTWGGSRSSRGGRRTLVAVIALALPIAVAHAETVARGPAETDGDLMTRVLGPSSELAQKVLRSTELAGGKTTLIGFANTDEDLIGHLLIEISPDRYEHVTFPSCEQEGRAPELLAVFFARTTKAGGRDLAVLCRWDVRHAVANGESYGAQFYKLKEAASRWVVEPVTDLNAKFQTDELVQENEHGKLVRGPKAKFTTVAQVKRLLTKMGLKQ